MTKSKWQDQLKTDVFARALIAIIVLITGFLLIFLINNVISHFENKNLLYRDIQVFPAFSPAGNDFRVGYFLPAHYLIESHFTSIGPNGTYPSNYPPLTTLSGLPYVLFNATDAYSIHVFILILLNILCLLMAVSMVKQIFFKDINISELSKNLICLVLFSLLALYVFSSYFFLFSIERGNTDIIVLFYCMLAMWVLIKYPQKIWLQVIFLSIAVHFKIYPLVLFPILLLKHGKKLFITAILINIAFLFCLGPKLAWQFFQSVTAGGQGAGIGNGWASVFNHASYSFAYGVDKSEGPYLSGTFFVIWGIAFLIPFVIWGITTIGIIMKKYSLPNAVQLFMVSVPLMCLLPTYSMDYRLVIFGVEIILLLGLIFKQFLQKFTWFDLVQLVLLVGVLLMLHRSYALIDKNLEFIRNKYFWILLLEFFISLNILRNQKACYSAEKMLINAISSEKPA